MSDIAILRPLLGCSPRAALPCKCGCKETVACRSLQWDVQANGSSDHIRIIVRRGVYGALISDAALVLCESVGLAVACSGRYDPSASQRQRLSPSGPSGKLRSLFGADLRDRQAVAGIQKRAESRRVNIWLAFPVGVLVILACVPTLDPLWPAGMSQLARQEAQLQEILPVGIDLEQARGVLRSQGIQSWEHVEKYDNVIFTRPEGSTSVASGDIVISAQIWTKAGQFPCVYRIDVVLLFGKEQRLTKRSIHRMRMCP